MMISYGCVYKRSSKPVVKGSKIETIEDARNKLQFKNLVMLNGCAMLWEH